MLNLPKKFKIRMTSNLIRINNFQSRPKKKKKIAPKVKTHAVKPLKMVWIIAMLNSLPQTRNIDPPTSTDLLSEGSIVHPTTTQQSMRISKIIQKTTNLKLFSASSQITSEPRPCWQMRERAPESSNGATRSPEMAMKSRTARRRDCRQIERDSPLNGQANITTHTKWTKSQPILPQIT